MMHDINELHARFLRLARLKQRLTIPDLEAKSGVTRQQILRIESGESSPTLSTLNKLYTALGFQLTPPNIDTNNDDTRTTNSTE